MDQKKKRPVVVRTLEKCTLRKESLEPIGGTNLNVLNDVVQVDIVFAM
jgi:hypothetical protein